MRIKLTKAGKRFNREWIFRGITFEFLPGNFYAITGPNGSGKSTLLQLIAGATTINEGTVDFFSHDTRVENDKVYSHLSIAAPYLELIEEMTLKEFLHFHSGLKPFLAGFTIQKILSIIGLEAAVDKQIRYFSSGMKQRVKLAQAIFSDVPVVLLDEPTTNLDAEGVALYRSLVENYCRDRLVIISSNDIVEYDFCEQRINISEYK